MNTSKFLRIPFSKDSELKHWARDLHDNGYQAESDGSVDKGFPATFTTRENLAHFLTMIIFTSSCQHAAVNFSQMDVYGFIPNTPAILRKPPPSQKGEVNLRHIMDALPTKHEAAITISIMYGLTRIYPTEVRFAGLVCWSVDISFYNSSVMKLN